MNINEFIKHHIIRIIRSRTEIIGDCWCHTSSVNSTTGYADIIIYGRLIGVHRLISSYYHGLDLDDSNQFALHKKECKYKNCWNPEHLYVGTHADNMKDISDEIRSNPCRKCGSIRRYTYRKRDGTRSSYCKNCKEMRKKARRN